jgi:hypothetical protein
VLLCMRFWRFRRFYVLANSGSTPTNAFELCVNALMCPHIEVERDRFDSTDPAPPSCLTTNANIEPNFRGSLAIRLKQGLRQETWTPNSTSCPSCNGIFSCYQGATNSTFVYVNVGLLDPRKFLKNLHYSLRHLLRPRYSPR